MGAWDIGPFDNDTAADFSGHLDDREPEQREHLIRTVLTEAADTPAVDYLDSYEGNRAVAAAALVAAQCPDGETVDPSYGPKKPVPVLSPDLRPLAVAALDRIMAPGSESAELWEGEDAVEWQKRVGRIRAVLTATGPTQQP
ncbi:DUF4259 domain-containing protein [Streptomyces qinzhouensis]|uniref:DUF4259 domain-containing protein n=1 Tax=Streptomyces qinzhouensis TaxID=2599401 RepID=A0A5B8JSC1_9ACTN|nr:DUF4259 domain-containing protein [Streptomyces qinzhouensis]QDY80970.1 DUF4259 domain-containing protein [Streptomyces qinzhouensis]